MLERVFPFLEILIFFLFKEFSRLTATNLLLSLENRHAEGRWSCEAATKSPPFKQRLK